MATIVAILIFFKDHLFPPIRQIDSKLRGRDRGNMEIQNCSNHSILISNLAPMAAILIFVSKEVSSQTIHVCQNILKLVERHRVNFLNAASSDIDHRNIQCSALTLTTGILHL